VTRAPNPRAPNPRGAEPAGAEPAGIEDGGSAGTHGLLGDSTDLGRGSAAAPAPEASGPILAGALEGPPRPRPFGGERWTLAGGTTPLEVPAGLVRAGDVVAVAATARLLRPATGPDTEPGAAAALAARPRPDELRRLSSRPGAPLWPPPHGEGEAAPPEVDAGAGAAGPLAAVHQALVDARARAIVRLAATELPHHGLLAALLLDAREDVDPEVGELFTRTGTRHILALSGMHVALVAWLVGRPLARVSQAVLRGGAAFAAGLAMSGLSLLRLALAPRRASALASPTLTASCAAPSSDGPAERAAAAEPGETPTPASVSTHATRATPTTWATPTTRATQATLTAVGRAAGGAVVRTLRFASSAHVLLAVGALAYVPIAGGGAPAARAAVALALASLAAHVAPAFGRRRPSGRPNGAAPARRFERTDAAGLVGRRPDAPTLWGAALLLEVMATPNAPLDLGVQLSYAATLALILVARPAFDVLAALLPGGARIAPVDRGGRLRSALWRVPLERLLRWSVAALAVGLVAGLATLPLAWARFGEWSPIGVLATPAVTPLISAVLVLGYTWLVAPGLVPTGLLVALLDTLVASLAWFDRAPGSPLVLPVIPTAWLVFAAVGALGALALAPRLARGPRLAALALSHASLALPMAAPPGEATALEVVPLDVGDGRAVLLRAPGAGVWLIDAGSRDRPGVARRAVLPTLRAWRTRTLGVVLTAPDAAHGGALPWLTERFHVHTWLGAPPEAVGARTRGALQADTRVGVSVLTLGPDLALELTRSAGPTPSLALSSAPSSTQGRASDLAVGERAEPLTVTLCTRGRRLPLTGQPAPSRAAPATSE
jgi:predicted membrane metal-binding protein